ncbi:MAG: acylphosphatase [Tunicatimonas sp.]
MMRSLSIRVSGKVQGVFFRTSTQEEAQRLGLSGWVRNEPDGTVLIEAEGEQEALDRLVAWCHRGPERARVTNVHVQESELKGYSGFLVRR